MDVDRAPRRLPWPWLIVISFAVAVVGGVLVAVGLMLRHDQNRAIAHQVHAGERIAATVDDIHHSKNDVYYRVAFTAHNRSYDVWLTPVGDGSVLEWGQIITIMVDPVHPERVVTADSMTSDNDRKLRWEGTALVGATMVLVGAGNAIKFWWTSKRGWRTLKQGWQPGDGQQGGNPDAAVLPLVLRGYDKAETDALLAEASSALASDDQDFRLSVARALERPRLRVTLRGYDRTVVDRLLRDLGKELTD